MTTVFKNHAVKGLNGKIYAPGKSEDGRYFIFILRESYASHVRGGIAKSWRVIRESEKGLSLQEARDLLEKKTGKILYQKDPITEYYQDRATSGLGACNGKTR